MKKRYSIRMILLAVLLCVTTGCSIEKNTNVEDKPEIESQTDTEFQTEDTEGNNSDYTEVNQGTRDSSADKGMDKLKEYFEAGRKEILWKHHHNQALALYKYINEEPQEPMRFYIDDKNAVWYFEDGRSMCYGNDHCHYIILEGDTERYSVDLADRDELYKEWFEEVKYREYIVLHDEDILLETKEEDNVFEALIEIRDTDLCDSLAESEGPDYPDDFKYQTGMFFRYLYRFDTQTKEPLGYVNYYVDLSGEVHTLAEVIFLYDVEDYDPYAEGEPYGEFKAMKEDPEQSRKVTITFDPDTANENVREFVLPKTTEFLVVYRESELVKELYTDRACTIPYAEGKDDGDIKLFVKYRP